jgi:hypothetical protein
LSSSLPKFASQLVRSAVHKVLASIHDKAKEECLQFSLSILTDRIVLVIQSSKVKVQYGQSRVFAIFTVHFNRQDCSSDSELSGQGPGPAC